MKQKHHPFFTSFIQAESDREKRELGDRLDGAGYSLFNELLNGLKRELTDASEEGLARIKTWIAKGREIVPSPETISPLWERVWDDHERLAGYKEEALRTVPSAERDGEWQVIMDNPFDNEAFACYPGLTFVEAAYFYAYFRIDLKRNEYVRLQKIVNMLVTQGS